MLKQTPKEELLQLLSKRYPSAQLSIVADLVTAKLLLMDTTYGDEVMSKLQLLLKPFDPSSAQVDLFLCKEEEEKRGFTHRKQVDSILSREDFMKLLSNGQHILDLGAGPNHGLFSHRLQWYILYHAYDEKKLKTEPIVLFKTLGTDAFNDSNSKARSMWDEIFDFDDGTPRLDAGSKQEAEKLARYSSAEMTLKLLCDGNVIKKGPLVQELQLTRLRYQTFGAEGIENLAEALRDGIQMKYMGTLDLSAKNIQDKVNEYMKPYANATVSELEKAYCLLNEKYAEALQKILS